MYRRYTLLLQLAQGKDVQPESPNDKQAIWALVCKGYATLVITPEGMKEAEALSPRKIEGARAREMVEDGM